MPASTSPLVLGSGSRYRRELLQRVVSEFVCVSPDVDETPQPDEPPAALALRLATQKALAASAGQAGSLVIGSDQVAAVDSEKLGKPGNHERAHAQLSLCSGKAVTFYTAVCLMRDGNELASHTDITVVNFRQLTAAEIDAYLEKDQPWDCAGSFKSEGLGCTLFESIESLDPNALIGLPLIWLCSALREAGLDPLTG
jgi:septum formation protein